MKDMTAARLATPMMTNGRPTPATFDGLQDEELMSRLSHGEAGALEELYRRYGNLVYSTALRVLRDTHLAEDISQEVFTRLWRAPEKYAAEKGRFVTWVLSVTRNRAVDWLRKRRRQFPYETASPEERDLDIPAGDCDDPALSAEQLEQRRTVRALLASLPREQRRAIELAYFGGFSNREVALLQGAPLGTVKTRIRLGMMRLREELRPRTEPKAEPLVCERGSVV